jgi:AcrR family transcriptional regulator
MSTADVDLAASGETSRPSSADAPAVDWRADVDLELTPILSAALDAFYEHGYHGASVRDLASRVGVTVPALYYHHENKEAILFALLDASIEKLLGSTIVAYESARSPEEQFFNLVECSARFMARSGKIAYLDGEIRSLSPQLRAVYSAKRDQIEAMLVSSLEAGVKEGSFEVTVPRDTVRALLGMIQAIAIWYRPDGDLSVEEVARRYLDIAAHTVGASPAILAQVRHPKPRTRRRSPRR